jgi:uncharacterized protein YwqG
MWQEDVGAARVAQRELDCEAAVAAAKGKVVRWRRAVSSSTFFDPMPLVARRVATLRGSWIDDSDADEEELWRVELVGFDAHDRPVVVVERPGDQYERVTHLWDYRLDGFDAVAPDHGSFMRCATDADGRVRHVVACDPDGEVAVQLLTWRGAHAIRCDEADALPDLPPSSAATTALYDGEGNVERLLRAYSPGPKEGPPADLIAALATALDVAATLTPDQMIWDGRVRALEPWPADPEALIESLAQALDRALRAAAAEAGVSDPFCLAVHMLPHLEHPAFPPAGLLAGVVFRDRMRAASVHDGAALQQLRLSGLGAGVAALELTDYLDADALRACRALSSAFDGAWSSSRQAAPVAEAVGERLAVLLNERPFAGAVDPFAALVDIGDPFEHRDAMALFARAAGPAATERFKASVASAASALDQDAADALAVQALVDRDALEHLLSGNGLPDHAHRLAHEVATWGLLLSGTEDTSPPPRSRLGGPAVLAPGEPWPTAAGRPLSFLAAFDLDELDASRIHDAMPDSGWLLFFADLDEEGVMGEEPNKPDSALRVYYVSSVSGPVPAAAPDKLRTVDGGVLRNRPITANAVLSLPDGYGAAAELGLDTFEGISYEEILELLRGALNPAQRDARRDAPDLEVWDPDQETEITDEDGDVEFILVGSIDHAEAPDDTWPEPDDGHAFEAEHWIGGQVTGVQGHPPEPDTVLLLHLAWDDALGFGWGDGGAFQFHIPAEALARRDWAQITLSADCC